METLERALYNVYEAKKSAEGVQTVGKTTTITVLYANGGYDLVTEDCLHFLEGKYQAFGPKKLPRDTLSEFVTLKQTFLKDMT